MTKFDKASITEINLFKEISRSPKLQDVEQVNDFCSTRCKVIGQHHVILKKIVRSEEKKVKK